MNNYEKYELQKHSSMKNQRYLFDKMNLDSDVIISGIKNKNLCSIKSFSNIIPKDIKISKIISQIVNSPILSNGENNIYIKLSQEQLIKRQYVIESIKKFIILHKISYKILYNIIFLFDILIYVDHKSNLIQNYEKIGLGSTILMIKYFHEENKIISLNKYQTFYERIHYPKFVLKEIEIFCLKLIDYYMNFPTPLLYIELYFFDNLVNETNLKINHMTLHILEIILIKSNEYTKYSLALLSSSIISYCRQYYGLEKWSKNLSRVFNIKLKSFENIIEELLPLEDNLNIKNLTIKTKLFNKKINEKIIILRKYKGKIEDEKNKPNIYNNHINKDIKVNINSNLEEKVNSQINIFKINNNAMNINLNYRTSEELRNSSLFKKINSKYNNKSLKEINISNSLSNINQKNESNTISNNENGPRNELTTNTYKTPDKIINKKNSSYIYNHIKKGIKYYNNNIHHRNISNIDIVNNNNINNFDYENEHQILFKRGEINNYESNKDNDNTNNRMITINRNEERKIYKKFYNKINEDINNKINSNDKEEKGEIKVRVKEFNYQKKNSDIDLKKRNNIVSKEEEINLKNKDNIINNSKSIMNNTYKKNILAKNNKSLMTLKNSNNESDNILRKSSEDNFMKNISINRLSSCNNKYKSKHFYIHNEEVDYSNDTTSENSHNISIRRNYFRLRKLKDTETNNKNENITTISGSNENNYIIKCNLKNREDKSNINNREGNSKGNKYSKIKDCLKIGSIDRKFIKKIKDNNIENERDYSQSANNTKRVDIRSYYKLKNINKHY